MKPKRHDRPDSEPRAGRVWSGKNPLRWCSHDRGEEEEEKERLISHKEPAEDLRVQVYRGDGEGLEKLPDSIPAAFSHLGRKKAGRQPSGGSARI